MDGVPGTVKAWEGEEYDKGEKESSERDRKTTNCDLVDGETKADIYKIQAVGVVGPGSGFIFVCACFFC